MPERTSKLLFVLFLFGLQLNSQNYFAVDTLLPGIWETIDPPNWKEIDKEWVSVMRFTFLKNNTLEVDIKTGSDPSHKTYGKWKYDRPTNCLILTFTYLADNNASKEYTSTNHVTKFDKDVMILERKDLNSTKDKFVLTEFIKKTN